MKLKFLLLVLMCSVAAPLSAQNESTEGSASAIRALEQQWTVGQSRNDNGALDLIFDNALVYVEYGRLMTKGEYLSRVKHAEPGTDQIAMQPMTVRILGQTAIVTGTYSETQVQGRQREAKRWRFVDTWTYKKNGWVLIAAGSAPIRAD